MNTLFAGLFIMVVSMAMGAVIAGAVMVAMAKVNPVRFSELFANVITDSQLGNKLRIYIKWESDKGKFEYKKVPVPTGVDNPEIDGEPVFPKVNGMEMKDVN